MDTTFCLLNRNIVWDVHVHVHETEGMIVIFAEISILVSHER